MTEQTLHMITVARRLVCGETGMGISRRDLAWAIVELAGGKPNAIDRKRVDSGDWTRAGGDTVCAPCGQPYIEHADVPGFEWLHRLCDGRFVKL